MRSEAVETGLVEAMSVPDRDAVADRWLKLIRGELTREEVHAWAKPWVEYRFGEITDPLVTSGLTYLHGFDMVFVEPGVGVVRHGGPGRYVHSGRDISDAFDRWKAKCDDTPLR